MKFQAIFEIPFADVDQHGVLHHPKYLNYLEQTRIKLLNHVGLNYSQWIEKGYMLPVSELQVRYHAPLKMGELFCVSIPKLELRARRGIHIFYEGHKVEDTVGTIDRSSGLICEAIVKLICVRIQDNRVCVIPEPWHTALQSYASKSGENI